MKPKILFFSFNSFTAIPVFRLIISGLDQSLFSKTAILECFLDDMSSRFENGIQEHTDLLHFKNANDFNNQSTVQKFKKYFLGLKHLIKFIQNDSVLYTCDIEVLALGILVKKMKKSRCKIVYHQFEAIEGNRAIFLKRLSITYIRSRQGIDLAIFPEQNRLMYFANMINKPTLNSLLFPNTCHPVSQHLENSTTEESILIGHVGNLSMTAFYLNEFLEGVKMISGNDFKFVFVGIKNREIREKIIGVIPDAVVIGWMGHGELKNVYRTLDIGLILYKPLDFNTDYCAPNKLYEYWSYGVPVVAPKLKGLLPIFDSPTKGQLVDFNHPTEVAESFSNWTRGSNSKKRLERKRELTALFQQTLAVDIFIRKWESKLKELIE